MGRALLVLMQLLLTSCILSPGKFVSTLRINADRHFAFTYTGEVYGDDPAGESMVAEDAVLNAKDVADAKAAIAAREVRYRDLAAALAREAGYRKAVYVGDGKFEIDYAIAGTLDHGFVFPFNSDAKAFVPFVAIELRKDNTAHVMAFGAADPDRKGHDPGRDKIDGTFTLTTDAALLSHTGTADPGAGPMHILHWTVTPRTTTIPSAVVQFR